MYKVFATDYNIYLVETHSDSEARKYLNDYHEIMNYDFSLIKKVGDILHIQQAKSILEKSFGLDDKKRVIVFGKEAKVEFLSLKYMPITEGIKC